MAAIAPARPPKPLAERAAPTWKTTKGVCPVAQRIVVYGTGKIGKTSLIASASKLGWRPIILDVEEGSKSLDIERFEGIDSFESCIALLRSDALDPYDIVAIDSGTRLEEMITAAVIQQAGCKGIEEVGGGWGKGFTRVHELWLSVLAQLDTLVRRGKHVVIVCHDCTTPVPNPEGVDYLRYEPRLQSPAAGKNSNRLRTKEWADHVCFVSYDLFVDGTKESKVGKAQGCGSRSIHFAQMPAWLAGSRSQSESITFEEGSAEFWKRLIGRKS